MNGKRWVYVLSLAALASVAGACGDDADGTAGSGGSSGASGMGGSAGSSGSAGMGGDGGSSGPIISLTATTDTVDESLGTSITFNFAVEGEIPAEGIEITMEGDAPRITRQFTAGQVRVSSEPPFPLTWRFDSSVADTATGGVLVRDTALEDDPEDPGFLSDFVFTITSSIATVTYLVLDDILEEPDQTFTYTLADGADYDVDPDASSVTFTVTDGVTGGTGPTVGVTATPLELVEADQTEVMLTFTVEGDIPEGGVVVDFSSDTPRAVAEFDVNATNPRLPEEEFEAEGPVVTNGTIVGTNEVASALLFRITDTPATLSVEVWDDGVEEDSVTSYDFALLDGEDYEVDPANSGDTVTVTRD